MPRPDWPISKNTVWSLVAELAVIHRFIFIEVIVDGHHWVFQAGSAIEQHGGVVHQNLALCQGQLDRRQGQNLKWLPIL